MWMRTIAAFAAGAAVAAVAGALAGRNGRRRRALVRDKLVHGLHEARDVADATARDVTHRARGAAAEVRGGLRAQGESVPDDVLVARARSRLGHVCSHPHALQIVSKDGVLEVTGPIRADEHDLVVRALRHVRGVKDVVDHLDVHTDIAPISSLQGEGRRLSPRWTPTSRLLTGTLGAGLVLAAFRVGRGLGFGLGSAGALLLGRAVGNGELHRLVGMNDQRGVDVQKTIFVHAPADDVFARFSALESFPRFMTHVKEVRHLGNAPDSPEHGGLACYHWRVEGPLGVPAEWDAVITRFEPGRLIAWKSIEGSVVDNMGTIHFEESERGTRMTVQLSYRPPAGAVGYLIAKVFGRDARKLLDDDLLRFQSLVEKGRATGAHGQVSADDIPTAEVVPQVH